MPRYSHRERIEMIVAGEKPDRYAASFWRHYFHMEHHAEGTVEAMLQFQKQFDWDFMKINPRADFHIEGWGFRHEWSHDEFKKHRKLQFPVTKVEDWGKIKPLPLTSPSLAEHLKVVSEIRRKSDPELPLLMTVFNPLSIAGRMVPERPIFAEHLRSHPELVEKALEAIAETFAAFVADLRNAGADGIFFATLQWASSNMLTWEEYERFGVPYDLKVMQAAEDDAINLLNVCDSNNYLEQLAGREYPAQMINWNSGDPTNLSLERAAELMPGRVLVSGVDNSDWLINSDSADIGRRIDQIKEENDNARLIIGPGCVVDPATPPENLQTIRDRL